MSVVKVIINTEFFENYNVTVEGFNTFGDKQPIWKAKGGHQFQIEIDLDDLMYTDANSIFTQLIEDQSTEAEKFRYLDHIIEFQAPTKLLVADYEAIARRMQE